MTALPLQPLISACIIPVVVIERLEDAVPLAEALYAGGLTTLEITLRTPCALEALATVAKALPEANVGAGTVTNSTELAAVIDAGAQFAIAPGQSPALLAAGSQSPVPLIPGAVTPSEVMAARDAGYRTLKFFPASVAGGAAALGAFAGPFKDVTFIPTGGINPANLSDYLKLANVVAAGGSWMLPADKIQAQDWPALEALAREAVSLAATVKRGK